MWTSYPIIYTILASVKPNHRHVRPPAAIQILKLARTDGTMAAAAVAQLAPAFDACGARVASDAAKGRVVFSERAFRAGDVIFQERAFVFAPWSTELCGGCEEPRSSSAAGARACHCERTGKPRDMYAPRLQQNIGRRNVVVGIMASIDGIDEVDRARCVLKCLAKLEMDPRALDHVLSLACSPSGYERAVQAVQQLRRQAPEVFPDAVLGFPDDHVAKLLGVLNTNSHELENLGGSGLFLSACRMEHSCAPNCSFTTLGDTLWMTAIRDVAPGDALSIDYGNFFYRPTPERRESLRESYGFDCLCSACVAQPDVCRAFRCQNRGVCASGVVFPYPVQASASAQRLEFEWKCSDCGRVASPQERQAMEQEEQTLMDDGFPETLAQVDAVVARGLLHERHYLLFWALDAMGCDLLETAQFQLHRRDEIAQIWTRIIASMNAVVPGAHHEKTIYYDNLAQVHVVLGDVAGAAQAYAAAYEMSCVVSGRDCEPTHKLRALMENPPRSTDELRRVYEADERARQSRRRPQAGDDDDDDDDMDE